MDQESKIKYFYYLAWPIQCNFPNHNSFCVFFLIHVLLPHFLWLWKSHLTIGTSVFAALLCLIKEVKIDLLNRFLDTIKF